MDLADGAGLIGRTGWQRVGGSGAAHGSAAVSAVSAAEATEAAANQEVAEAIAGRTGATADPGHSPVR